MSIQAGFIGALAEILSPDSKNNNLFMIPEDLAASSGYLMSLAMVLAGILIICAYRNDFLIFMALILWLFGLIFGLIFHPELFGFLFPPNRMFNKLFNGPIYFYRLHKAPRHRRGKVSELLIFFI